MLTSCGAVTFLEDVLMEPTPTTPGKLMPVLVLKSTPEGLNWPAEHNSPLAPVMNGGEPPAAKPMYLPEFSEYQRQQSQVNGSAAPVRCQEYRLPTVRQGVCEGVFERILRRAGRLPNEQFSYMFYDPLQDATISNAKDDVGFECAHVGRSLTTPLSLNATDPRGVGGTTPANIHGTRPGQQASDFVLPAQTLRCVVGHAPSDNDILDERPGSEPMKPPSRTHPHCSNPRSANSTHDGDPLRR